MLICSSPKSPGVRFFFPLFYLLRALGKLKEQLLERPFLGALPLCPQFLPWDGGEDGFGGGGRLMGEEEENNLSNKGPVFA